MRLTNTSAEEDDLEQAQTNLSWLNLKGPGRSALPPDQGFPFPGKLQPGSSALPTLIYEQTRELCQFGECICPLILALCQKRKGDLVGIPSSFNQKMDLFFFCYHSCRVVTLLINFKLGHRATSMSY